MVFDVMKMKSSSKKLICFYLLLLLYFQSSSSSSSSCSSFVVSAFSQQLMPVESHGGFEANDNDDGDEGEDFGDEKRKVYTGPNPLHNR